EIGGSRERIRHGSLFHLASSGRIRSLAADKSSADGVVNLGVHHTTVFGEGGEAHSVRMSGKSFRLTKNEVARLIESNGPAMQEVQSLFLTNLRNQGFDLAGVDLVGGFSEQPQDHGAISSVAASGERERAKEFRA